MNAISKYANYHLRRIACIRKYCSTHINRTLINVLVLSRIDYCGSLFSDTNNTDIKKVDRIIRASTQLSYNVNRRDHTLTYMYQHNLKWLSFRKRCKQRLLCLAQQTLLRGKPGYLNNLLKRRVILRHNRTSDVILLEGGTTRNAFNYRAFSSVIPRKWHSLSYVGASQVNKSGGIFSNKMYDIIYLNMDLLHSDCIIN